MSIQAISSNTPGLTALNPVAAAPAKAASPSSSKSTATPSTASPATTASTAAASTSRTPASGASGSAHSSGGASAGSSTAAETLVSSYSATVGGTQYSGSVEESGGEYTASVPNVPGASATGSTLAAAENSLTLRIDELV